MSKKKSAAVLAGEIADFLMARIEGLLAKWRNVCEADPSMSSKSAFTREEFNDQVPVMLEILLCRLRGEEVELDPVRVANEHGLHRWQSGYGLPDLIREIEHLFNIILDEVSQFPAGQEKGDLDVVLFANKQIFRIYGELNRGSLQYYHQLNQNEASERTKTLQIALDQLQQLGKQRGHHLRQNSHDLRTSLGTALAATKLLSYPDTEKGRKDLIDVLNRNLNSVKDMLLQLTDYAQLEAGYEELSIDSFDAAKVISETLQSNKVLADQKGLTLEGNGPDKLEVTGDRIKVQRILLNLLHNALKYTDAGGVFVTWAIDTPTRWVMSIQDTGRGFTPNTPAAVLAAQLRPAIQTTSAHPGVNLSQDVPLTKPEGEADFKESEGLGLFIVKKLCELLNASMDIESTPGKGTLIRVRFPIPRN